MDLQFLGAADTVTGSRHRVALGGQSVLLDCGLFQGYKTLRERNWAPMPAAASEVDAVLLSHAHLDHSGALPLLVRAGFRGPVHCTAATRDLCEVLLLDSAHLAEEDARRANRDHTSRHTPARPLYTVAEARRAIAQLRPLARGRDTVRIGHVTATFRPAGHLLGASWIALNSGDERLVYSGDLGRSDDLLMPPPEPLEHADVLLVESTYGQRLHPPGDPVAELGAIVRDTIGRGGSVLLPTFAVGRAQALLLALQRLKEAGELPAALPVVLDSPMAIQATALYQRHRRGLRISAAEAAGLDQGVMLTASSAASMRLASRRMPMVILAASGMATGGRVLHHLKRMAPDPRHAIVFPGFQAGGTRGARLLAGETEVKIHGAWWPVRARVSQIAGLSGHADAQGLMEWVSALARPPRSTFVVHGEAAASDALRHRLQERWNSPVHVPEHGSSWSA